MRSARKPQGLGRTGRSKFERTSLIQSSIMSVQWWVLFLLASLFYHSPHERNRLRRGSFMALTRGVRADGLPPMPRVQHAA